jgi:DNA-binding MarR family transcriptional regulator
MPTRRRTSKVKMIPLRAVPSPAVLVIALLLLLLLLLLGTFTAAEEESIITGRVRDTTTMEPIEGANVTISDRDNGTVLGQTTTDADGRYTISVYEFGWMTVTVRAEGYENATRDFNHSGIFGPFEVDDLHLSPINGPTTPGTSSFPYLQYGALIAIILVTSTVMYSKIRRENLLRHAVRSRIYEYVKENPGQHYRAILHDLDLSMGVLTYHLNRLEKGEYLRSRQDGMYRRFFVAGRKTEARFFLSDIQESILATIRDNQGISQSRIAEGIGVTRKVVNYHIRIMERAGLIYLEEKGRETACFASMSGSSGSV